MGTDSPPSQILPSGYGKSSAASQSVPLLVVTPKRRWELPNLVELFERHEMIASMVWRDILTLYRQSGLGMMWMLIKPFAQMVIFTLLFGGLANLDSEGVPYCVFNFAALVPWTFFSNSLTQSTNSVVTQGHMYSKLVFPRLTLPVAALFSGSLDFAVQMGILFLMMAYFGIAPTWNLVWLPFFLLFLLLAAFGISLLLGTLNVMFRDVNQSMPVLIQFWMFVSPVVYSSKEIPEQWQYLYALNPMTGVINGIRWSLLNTPTPPDQMAWISLGMTVVILVVGMLFFQRMQDSFPDYLINP
ncbi:MAG TPA: ABC transporter permease [bacterium]|nr:ABC transporter permease [bacterium]HQO36697.1 ABC transporter permease [bacterium]HQP99184.1 ABC transporter permease [bacterium]